MNIWNKSGGRGLMKTKILQHRIYEEKGGQKLWWPKFTRQEKNKQTKKLRTKIENEINDLVVVKKKT